MARRAWAVAMLAAGFLWDLVASSLAVARIILSPAMRNRPAIVAMPVAVRTPRGVAMLAYFTSLTPGSTCLHVSDDRRLLYLHILDLRDPDAALARFRRIYERHILELER